MFAGVLHLNAGHAVQAAASALDAAALLRNLPAAQLVHEGRASASWNFPVEQALQLRTLNTILTKVADFVQAHPGLSTVAHLFSAFAKLHPGVKPPKGLKWTAFLTKHAAALAHVFTLEPIDDSGNMTIVRAI